MVSILYIIFFKIYLGVLDIVKKPIYSNKLVVESVFMAIGQIKAF